jgi:transcriptional regulator
MSMAGLPLLKGTLDVLVLKALAWGPKHGVEIVDWLEDRSGGSLDVDDGALYFALHRLEERGLVSSDWDITDNNRRARYYKLLPAGRAFLKEQGAALSQYADVINAILGSRS